MNVLALFVLALLGLPFAGEATWVHPSLHGKLTRAEVRYDQQDPAFVAVGVRANGDPVLPLGTHLLICSGGRCIRATVKDTGRFPVADLDLSPATFRRLGAPLAQGRLDILWWPVEEES